MKVREAMGERAKRLMGETATRRNATKWQNRTAQGFSPGLLQKRDRPEPRNLSGEQGDRRGGSGRDTALNSWVGDENEQTQFSFGRPFRARPRSLINPGLKPWAILSSHFVAVGICCIAVRPFAGAPIRPFALSQLRRCRCRLLAGELR